MAPDEIGAVIPPFIRVPVAIPFVSVKSMRIGKKVVRGGRAAGGSGMTSMWRVGVVALAVAVMECRGPKNAPPEMPPPPTPTPTPTPSCDPVAGALAAEIELLNQGRADANFDNAFGPDSIALLDAADALRTKLVEEAAAAQGITLPAAAGSTAGCADAAAGMTRSSLDAELLGAVVIAAGELQGAVRGAPRTGTVSGQPSMKDETGSTADGTPTHTVSTMQIVTSGQGSVVQVLVTMSTSITAGNVTTTETLSITESMDVCPDTSGRARGTFTLTADGKVSDGSGYDAQTINAFSLVVDSSAHATSTEVTSAFAYHATGVRRADIAAHGTLTFLPDYSVTNREDDVDQTDGSAESEQLLRVCLFLFGQGAAVVVASDAEKKWRGGTCIEVRADPVSATVDANAAVTITATPRQKFEMKDLQVPVVATLTGVQSLDPENQPVAGPATFHYVAGSTFKAQGVVSLTSTSNRGIGTASATITVKCDDKMMCPDGQMLNLDTCKCECPQISCPAGQVLDPTTCQCACPSCPPGQTPDPNTCACFSCQIDEALVETSPPCKWIGTVKITSNESVESETPPVGGTSRKTSIDFTYDASLSVVGMMTGNVLTLSGTLSAVWHRVITDIGPDCTTTATTDLSVSTRLDQERLTLQSMGGGMLGVRVFFGRESDLTGSTTEEGSSSLCGDVNGTTPSSPLLIESFNGSGPASGSTFSGTSVFPTGFTLPDGNLANFNVTWNLSLVPP